MQNVLVKVCYKVNWYKRLYPFICYVNNNKMNHHFIEILWRQFSWNVLSIFCWTHFCVVAKNNGMPSWHEFRLMFSLILTRTKATEYRHTWKMWNFTHLPVTGVISLSNWKIVSNTARILFQLSYYSECNGYTHSTFLCLFILSTSASLLT